MDVVLGFEVYFEVWLLSCCWEPLQKYNTISLER